MFLKADDLLLLLLTYKICFSILGVAYADPFVVQIGSQKAISRGFTNFLQNYWIATEVINVNWIP